MQESKIIQILHKELIPALGCTEPIALAYAGAIARRVLGAMPEHVVITCSGNIIKNVKGVTVPNSGGLKGIDVAAVLGIVAGNADKELEVLQDVTAKDIEKTQALIATPGFFDCKLAEGVENLYVKADVTLGSDSASVTIAGRHTYVTEVIKNNTVVYRNEDDFYGSAAAGEEWDLTVKQIIEFAETVDLARIRDLIRTQIEMNSAIADEGLCGDYGECVGKTILECAPDCTATRARARASAGSDARMSGCVMPVVINSGSGNQGMTVSLPVIEYAKSLETSEEQLYRALLISNLMAIHIKHNIGSLSAFCGAVSAAAGVSAAITFLRGGSYEQICHAVSNTLADVGGIVCDGAKASCAAKIASAVDAAIISSDMALLGRQFQSGEGLVLEDIEQTIRCIGYVAKVGMAQTDIEILNVMIDKASI